MQGPPTAALALLLVVSGVAALGYEVLWVREFALLYGTTASGAAVVLAAYFAGLAAGAWLGGRLSASFAPLRLYAALELGIVLAVLVYLGVRPLLPQASVWLTHNLPAAALPAARTSLAFAVLLLPTALIGATFPAVAATRAAGDMPGITRYYAWNTLGGVLGALVFGLIVLRAVGVTGSFLVGMALNLSVAVAALALSRSAPKPVPPAVPFEPPRAATNVASVSGFAVLAAEVLWARGLAGVLSNSVYSIAIVLAAVLSGLVLGAAFAARLGRSSPGWVGPVAAASALAMLGSLAVLPLLPPLSIGLVRAVGVRELAAGLGVEAILALAVILVPATLLGMLLPLALGLGGAAPAGRLTGRVLASNTAAGIAGALAAAFFLLPRLGLLGGMTFVAAIVAALALLSARSGRARAFAAISLVAVGATALLPLELRLPWRSTGQEETLYYRDGAAATVMVTFDPRRGKRLRINGQYSLSGSADLFLELRMGHLPVLLHPAPRRLLVLGVGTASTIGATLAYPDVRIDAVELIPEVLEAAALFEGENISALQDPRARFIIDDARSHLLASAKSYDVILSDLFLPWRAGTGVLYSLETFRLARARLAPGGLYCQWLPLHQLDVPDLEAIVASFVTAFPQTQLWVAYHRSLTPLAALIGSTSPLRLDAESLRARLQQPDVAAGAGPLGLNEPRDLAVLYVAGDKQLRAAVAGVPPITDDRPRLDFSAPAAYFHQWQLAQSTLAWVGDRLDLEPTPIEGAAVSTELRGLLLRAQMELIKGDRVAELRSYLAALPSGAHLLVVREALVGIARERLEAEDLTTARVIAHAMRVHAPRSKEARSLVRATGLE